MKKVGFWGNYSLIFILPFLVRAMTPKIIFKNLDFRSICHEYLELQKNLKHFKFW